MLQGSQSAVCSNGAMGPAPVGAESPDVLAGSVWECRWNAPDDAASVRDMSEDESSWLPAQVPGTAAGALRALGQWRWGEDDQGLLDGSEWWYRCRFDAPEDSGQGSW